MSSECVVDTTVLQKANATLTAPPGPQSQFRKRLDLLERIERGDLTLLISPKLLHEYENQVPEPRNDYVVVFFQLLVEGGRAILNWPRWSGMHREKARRCRYPQHDDHVLRTALRPRGSTIYTEERPMLVADACIHRELRVHIRRP